VNSIISGRMMQNEEFEDDWQEFFVKRQGKIDKKTDGILRTEIDGLLKRIQDTKLQNAIADIIVARENIVTYAYYCQGMLDGIKQAALGESTLSDSTIEHLGNKNS
jgi:hypothetical protein